MKMTWDETEALTSGRAVNTTGSSSSLEAVILSRDKAKDITLFYILA